MGTVHGILLNQTLGKSKLFERSALPVALVVLTIAIALVIRDGVLYRSAFHSAQQAERVVSGTRSLLSDLKDAETGQRGFLLTGKAEYLEPYKAALRSINRDLDQLDMAAARARRERLRQLVNAKLAELETTVDLRKGGDPAAALKIVNGGNGKAVMDELRQLCAAMDEEARGPMVASQQAAEASASRLRWFSTGSLLVLFFLLAAAMVSIGRSTAARESLIKELDASQRAAAHARDTLELTLRSIGDAVIVADEKGAIQFLNNAARSICGWVDDSAIGQALPCVFRIINEKTRDTVEDPVKKVIRLGTAVGLANHTLLINKNGEEIPIDDSAAPIQDAGGRLLGVVLVFRDISERRRVEKEIEAGRAELSRSNQALLRSNTDLERFAFAVSHDLQEPLRTIASFTQLLAREPSPARAAEYVDFIVRGVTRMNHLIRDLLEYSRITDGSIAAVQPVNLQEVLGEVLGNLQAQISETGAFVRADDLPVVAAHRSSMVQVLQNLVGNGIKYAGHQRPEVRITSEQCNSGDWVVHVRDNGIGFEMQYADQIFEVFKRLHGESEYGGTGIGLAICKRIIELHGGSIWVESVPGRGSTFSFLLPATSRLPMQIRSSAGG